MSKESAGVVVLSTHAEAENAVKELQRAGFDLKKLSIVGKDYHTEENVVGYYNAGDRMKYWGKLGAFWGGCGVSCSGLRSSWSPALARLLWQVRSFRPSLEACRVL